jgi:hypothetical protein
MRKWYEFVNTLVLLGFGLFVLATLFGFENVLNGQNIVITFWRFLLSFAS